MINTLKKNHHFIKFFNSLFLFLFIHFSLFGQKVDQLTMNEIYNEVKTPYKYGLVIAPTSDKLKIDCPSVFRKGNHWYMMYIVFDGRGYETWLAKSDNLLNWKTLGRTLSFGKDTLAWDSNQKAGYIALQNFEWEGDYKVQAFKNKYWMSYLGGNDKGYEAGQLSVGISYTHKNIRKPTEWQRVSKPILTNKDSTVRWWENNKLYKSTIIWDKQNLTGYPFVMYYNASGDSGSTTKNKKASTERIGMAVSNDMIHWKRYKIDPIADHHKGITGDAVIQKIGNKYVLFYFGAFWEGRKDAFNRFACSYDLVNWTDWEGDDLIKPSTEYDEKFAHKPFVLKWKGVVYHFYNAVNNKDQRGIAVATSKDVGKSQVNFMSKPK